MSKFAVRVADDRLPNVGNPLTFSYPGTEWDMVAPFTCECPAKDGASCGRRIMGAQYADLLFLERFCLNDHIKHLLAVGRV